MQKAELCTKLHTRLKDKVGTDCLCLAAGLQYSELASCLSALLLTCCCMLVGVADGGLGRALCAGIIPKATERALLQIASSSLEGLFLCP